MNAKEFVVSKPDTHGPRPSKANRGDRVRLGEFDTGDEIIPPEEGVVLSVDWHDWGESGSAYMYVVEVDQKYRVDGSDDGLRECMEDQIEEKLETAS